MMNSFHWPKNSLKKLRTELKQINDAVVTMNAEIDRLKKNTRKKKNF
jgi:molecular chaperone GrpE (heat shock protein)